MTQKKATITQNNRIAQLMSGIEGLRLYAMEDCELSEKEEMLSRIVTADHLQQYVESGRYVDEYLSIRGMKKESLNSKWWRQFDHVRKKAVASYSRTSLYFTAASYYIANPNDSDLLTAGDLGAHIRYTLILYCAWYVSALYPEANYDFYRTLIDGVHDYVSHRTHPKLANQPPLTPDEREQIEEAAVRLRAIYDENPSTHPTDILYMFVSERYPDAEEAPEEDVQEEVEPETTQEEPVEKKNPPKLPPRYATLGNRLFDISDRQYQFALSVRPESEASVLPVPEDIMERLEFDEETGQLSITDENNKALSTLSGRLEKWTSKEKVTASDFMFLRTALTAVYRNRETIDQNFVTIKRSELGKHMGANLTATNAVDVIARLKPLEKLIGRTPDGSIYRVFSFLKYDADTETYSFACPFINQVVLRLEDKNQVEYKTKTKGIAAYNAPHINFLLHSTLHKERNKRAVQIVMAITNLLLQRAGETTRKPTGRDCFEAHIRYSTLISYCPMLAASLEECKRPANRNRILQSAFTKAQDLLRTQTDAYSHFENLKIPDLIVTNSTLEETIRITFTGIKRAD